MYISFEGADDLYDLCVQGELVGSGGVIETRQTAFEERKSHDVTGRAAPGKTVHLAVRVYDWQGAGGLFRPITVGTVRIGTGVKVLE